MKRYEVKYFNIEFPPMLEFNLPFIEPPEVKDSEDLAKMQADSQILNEYFFPGLSEVMMAVEFVTRGRYMRSGSETIEHVEQVLEKELQARENFPHTAYFRGAASMLELHKLLPRVGDRVRHMQKWKINTDEAHDDPVLEQLEYAIEFHSLMVDIQTALAGIQNQKLEKELANRDEIFYEIDAFDSFIPANEFANFSLTEADTSFSNEEVDQLFTLASSTSPSTWDLSFFQKIAEMLRSKGVDVEIEVKDLNEAERFSQNEPEKKISKTNKVKRVQKKPRKKPGLSA